MEEGLGGWEGEWRNGWVDGRVNEGRVGWMKDYKIGITAGRAD